MKENFFPDCSFSNLENLEQQALEWCRKADSKPHGNTRKIPLQELAAEGPLLRGKLQSDPDGLVSFDGKLYSVPWKYSGKEVQVPLGGGQVTARQMPGIVSPEVLSRRWGHSLSDDCAFLFRR